MSTTSSSSFTARTSDLEAGSGQGGRGLTGVTSWQSVEGEQKEAIPDRSLSLAINGGEGTCVLPWNPPRTASTTSRVSNQDGGVGATIQSLQPVIPVVLELKGVDYHLKDKQILHQISTTFR